MIRHYHYNFYFSFLLSYLFQQYPLDLSMFISSNLPPPLPSVAVCSCIISLYCTCSPSSLTAPKSVHMNITQTCQLPASTSSLYSLLRVPSSSDVSLLCLNPIDALILLPGPCQTLRGSTTVGPTVYFWFLLALTAFCSSYLHLLVHQYM